MRDLTSWAIAATGAASYAWMLYGLVAWVLP